MSGQEAPEQRAKCSCPQAGGTRLPTLFKERAQAGLQKEEEGRGAPGSGPESLTTRAGQAHPCPDLQRAQSQAQPPDGLAPVPWVPLLERRHQQCRHHPMVRGAGRPAHAGDTPPLQPQTARLPPTSPRAPNTWSLQGPAPTCLCLMVATQCRSGQAAGGPGSPVSPRSPGPVGSCWTQRREQGGALVRSHTPCPSHLLIPSSVPPRDSVSVSRSVVSSSLRPHGL